MTRPQHAIPMPDPPPGHRWQVSIGEDGYAVILWKENEEVTSARHRVQSWTVSQRDDIPHTATMLAGDILDWIKTRDDLQVRHIDAVLESKIGRIRHGAWRDWGDQ
jgi:hypothetical protein